MRTCGLPALFTLVFLIFPMSRWRLFLHCPAQEPGPAVSCRSPWAANVRLQFGPHLHDHDGIYRHRGLGFCSSSTPAMLRVPESSLMGPVQSSILLAVLKRSSSQSSLSGEFVLISFFFFFFKLTVSLRISRRAPLSGWTQTRTFPQDKQRGARSVFDPFGSLYASRVLIVLFSFSAAIFVLVPSCYGRRGTFISWGQGGTAPSPAGQSHPAPLCDDRRGA